MLDTWRSGCRLFQFVLLHREMSSLYFNSYGAEYLSRFAVFAAQQSYCSFPPIHCISPLIHSYQGWKAYCRNEGQWRCSVISTSNCRRNVGESGTTQIHTVLSTESNNNGKGNNCRSLQGFQITSTISAEACKNMFRGFRN